MQTLSYGYKKPQSGDNGSVFFPALEDNMQRLNDHNHDGVDSAILTTASLKVATQAISSASWSATSGGTYRQNVTISGGLNYDEISIELRDAATGHPLLLTVEKIDTSHYYVYVNDNTLDLTAVYGL